MRRSGILLLTITLAFASCEDNNFDKKILELMEKAEPVSPDRPAAPLSEETIFSPRVPFFLFAVDNRLVLIGGAGKSEKSEEIETFYEVWETQDGITWKNLSNDFVSPQRDGYLVAYFKNYFFLIGGGKYNDVWVSKDAITWKRIIEHASFKPFVRKTILTLPDKILLYNVEREGEAVTEYWESYDGINWRSGQASLPSRFNVVDEFFRLDNKAVAVINSETIYETRDGIKWDKVPVTKPFDGRFLYPAVTKGKDMFIIGGMGSRHDFFNGICNDVWKSEDGGITWEIVSKISSYSYSKEELETIPARDVFDTFPPRHTAAAAVLNGKIYLVGGIWEESPGEDQEVFMNDVWVSEDGVVWKHIAGTPLTQDEYSD